MKKSTLIGGGAAVIFILGIALFSYFQLSGIGGEYQPQRSSSKIPVGFVHRNEEDLVRGIRNETLSLSGVNFHTHFELEPGVFPLKESYGLADYERVQRIGMNTVRLGLHYSFFEDDATPYTYKSDGWDWLDRQVEYGKQAGVYLILDLEVYPGMEGDRNIWNTPDYRTRVKNLWKAIMQRYRNENVIAAYDLLSRPTLTIPTKDAWKDFAQELVSEMRKVDTNHLFIIENTGQVISDPELSNAPGRLQFLVEDNNVAYGFSFFQPSEYIFQLLPGVPDGGTYPGGMQKPSDIVFAFDYLGNPPVASGQSDWRLYSGNTLKVTDPQLIAAYPQFLCENTNGKAYFDSFTVYEINPGGTSSIPIMNVNIGADSEWQHTSIDGSGMFVKETTTGNNDVHSLSMSGLTARGAWYNDKLRFPLKNNYSYRINAFMKGENLNEPDQGCRASLGVEKSLSGHGFMAFNSDFLKSELELWTSFGNENKVPMIVTGFGPARPTLESSGKGVEIYMKNLLTLFNEKNLDFIFTSYDTLFFDDKAQLKENKNIISVFQNNFTQQSKN